MEHIAVPVAFTVLGAVLGFATARLNVWLDSKRQTGNFLKGVQSELRTLRADLQKIKDQVGQACADYADPQGQKDVIHFTHGLGMVFFTTQVSKLPEISDERIFKIINLYNDISAIQKFREYLTSVSFELVHEEADFDSPKAVNYFTGMKHLSQMIETVSADLDGVVQQL